MSSKRFIKFWPVTIIFLIGIIPFFYVQSMFELSYFYLITWIILFLIIQSVGAYFIGLNFHLNSINQLKTSARQVMLTFDDGPHNPNTTRVLSILEKHNVKALFFIIGKNIQSNESIIKQLVAEGHIIGNHSFSHHNFIDVWSTKKVIQDLAACDKLVQHYQSSKLFRPPYGVTNPNIARAVKRLGLQSIGWNVRSYDTSLKDVEKIKLRILAQLKPGAIILLHDRLDFMPELLDTLIPAIKEQGFEFTVTL